MIKFGGTLLDINGNPRTGTVGVMFSIYSEQIGGQPIWIETQNVEPDAHGKYSILLGSAHVDGLPMDIFTSGDARWLGAQPQLPGEAEQPRVLLVSVPYAMKDPGRTSSFCLLTGGKPSKRGNKIQFAHRRSRNHSRHQQWKPSERHGELHRKI
jgi:hypothetical protein